MGECIICGESTGFFSSSKLCDRCKLQAQRIKKDEQEYERKKALAPYTRANNLNELPIITDGVVAAFNARPNTPRLILKKDEKIYAKSAAILCEYRKDRHYEYGSQGMSFRIAKGMSYRIGSGRGHVISNDILVQTSKGLLLLTNKRIFLQPVKAEDKPVSIKISAIESYTITEDSLTIYKEGKERPIIFKFFNNENGVNDDIFGITLNHILNSNLSEDQVYPNKNTQRVKELEPLSPDRLKLTFKLSSLAPHTAKITTPSSGEAQETHEEVEKIETTEGRYETRC